MKQHRILQMTLAASLFIVASVLCGCSNSYSVRSTDYKKMNEDFKERNATIELTGGQEVPAKNVKVSDDSVSWIDPRTNEESRASSGRINKIVIKDHLLGAFEGLGIGLVGAGGLGALLGNVLVKTSEDKSLGTAIGLLLGAGTGGFIGLMVGAGTGHSYNYEFQESGRDDSNRKTLIEESSTENNELHRMNGGTEK
ncbi:MAG: hypothetical protein HW407_1850 [Bacteroidetes bacterium]|nr:hypothetical protein [Bacteroidota bacterium]